MEGVSQLCPTVRHATQGRCKNWPAKGLSPAATNADWACPRETNARLPSPDSWSAGEQPSEKLARVPRLLLTFLNAPTASRLRWFPASDPEAHHGRTRPLQLHHRSVRATAGRLGSDLQQVLVRAIR